jgi:hypothetical protein
MYVNGHCAHTFWVSNVVHTTATYMVIWTISSDRCGRPLYSNWQLLVGRPLHLHNPPACYSLCSVGQLRLTYSASMARWLVGSVWASPTLVCSFLCVYGYTCGPHTAYPIHYSKVFQSTYRISMTQFSVWKFLHAWLQQERKTITRLQRKDQASVTPRVQDTSKPIKGKG